MPSERISDFYIPSLVTDTIHETPHLISCRTMRTFLSVAAFGLDVTAVALPSIPGADIKAVSLHNTKSTPSTAPSSTAYHIPCTNPSDYGPDVVYAKPWPTSVTTTATPHATVIARRAERNFAELTQTPGLQNFPDFLNKPFNELLSTQTASPGERDTAMPTKRQGRDNWDKAFASHFSQLAPKHLLEGAGRLVTRPKTAATPMTEQPFPSPFFECPFEIPTHVKHGQKSDQSLPRRWRGGIVSRQSTASTLRFLSVVELPKIRGQRR
ncbi:hypothetical protein DPSP01_004692 [Paraphaeosphaeria sporulosa]